MAGLPKLPEPIRRLQMLRWDELIEKHGFTGAHLEWHESPVRRREAARPRHTLAPPPATSLNAGTFSGILSGTDGKPVLHEKMLERTMAEWVVRESDPKVIDSIGVAATVTLAAARFSQVAIDHLNFWAASADRDSDEFRRLLSGIAQSVACEVGDLWRKDPWHTAWFERACHKKVDEALVPLTKEWSRRAANLEIQSLETPHLSEESQHAPSREEGKRKIETSDSRQWEPKGNAFSKAADVVMVAHELAVTTDPVMDRTKMVDDFLLQCNLESAAGRKVLRKHIWLAVGHTHARQFQYWQERNDKATEEDDRSFRRILRMPPPEFIALLKKKGIFPSSS